MGASLSARREGSAKRLEEFIGRLAKAAELSDGKACVYATGSFGRGEASVHSDLDLFIVGKTLARKEGGEDRCLVRLDEICLKAELIQATRDLKLTEFSGDGEYLKHYTVTELVRTTGKPEDDASNTFTARLLLLLESRPLIGADIYKTAVDQVIAQYWGDFESHAQDFVPAFLANDILRLWRTFCVNYEARTSREPEEKRNKRRLKNYKLKFSRLLTCYSALLYLLPVYNRANTVTPDDVRTMVKLSPTERLEWILSQADLKSAHDKTRELLSQYESFLEKTNASESELLERFTVQETRRSYFREARDFSSSVFDLVDLLGQKSSFHKMLLV